MAKLSARGHTILARWSKTGNGGNHTWHYAFRSDGALLCRITSRYTDRDTDSGHWTIARRHVGLAQLERDMESNGYTKSHNPANPDPRHGPNIGA